MAEKRRKRSASRTNGSGKTARAKAKTAKRRPRSQSLPGMEDHTIGELESILTRFAEIRDEQTELSTEESALKVKAGKAMHKHGKTVYKHGGGEIRLAPGEEIVKIKAPKPKDETDGVDMVVTADAKGEQAVEQA